MFKLVTKSGSVYFVSKESKKFWGGKFTDSVEIESAQAFVGQPAEIKLIDGRVVRTSPIETIVAGFGDNHISFFRI